MSGADEIYALGRDFGQASMKVAAALFDVYNEQGEEFANDWRANAEESSGNHGRLYPPTIDHEMRIGREIAVEVGPNPARGRAALAARGYELGSENQPAHLDGTRELGDVERRLERAADTTLTYLIP